MNKNVKKNTLTFLYTALFLLFFIFSARLTSFDLFLFWKRKEHLTDIISKMFPPDWNYVSQVIFPLAATIRMSVTGTFLGAFFALLIAPLCAVNLSHAKPIRVLFRVLIQILRSFPALILALLSTLLFGLGTFAGSVAITLYTFAIVTRLTYEDIETTPLNVYRALLTMGSGTTASFTRGILPQIAPSYLTNVLYLLETNVRHSAILGYVGAGGIGLILNEKVSWREYEKVSVILVLLFFAICLIEWITSLLIRIIQNEKQSSPMLRNAAWGALAVLFLISLCTQNGPDFSHTSLASVKNMLNGLFHPDWGFFFQLDNAGLGYLLLETICISLIGTCIGAVIAFPLAFFNTVRLMPKPVALIFRTLLIAIRSVPFMIYGLIFIRVTGPGAFAGALTLAVCSIGLLSKRFTEAIDALDFRPYRALLAMGTSRFLSIRHGILPQLSRVFVSAVLYRFDINIREASILGLVGAGGIGAPLIFSMNKYAWNQTGAIALGMIVLVWVIDLISTRTRKL